MPTPKLSKAAIEHLETLVPTIQGLPSYDYDKRREMYREGYAFARKEMMESGFGKLKAINLYYDDGSMEQHYIKEKDQTE